MVPELRGADGIELQILIDNAVAECRKARILVGRDWGSRRNYWGRTDRGTDRKCKKNPHESPHNDWREAAREHSNCPPAALFHQQSAQTSLNVGSWVEMPAQSGSFGWKAAAS